MKRIVFALSILVSGLAAAQSQGYNAVPSDAQSQGVTVTTAQKGVIVALGGVVYQNVPTGQQCQQFQMQQNQPSSQLNPGSIGGAVIGGLIGSQLGRGTGRDIFIAAGAATGAAVGNNSYQQNNQVQQQTQCRTVFEQRIVGYRYTVQYGYVQLEGVSTTQKQIGDTVDLKVRSTVWIGY